MFIRDTLRRVPGYTVIGAAILVLLMTFLIQVGFGQSTTAQTLEIDLPTTVVRDVPPGGERLLTTQNVPRQLQGLTCSARAEAQNQSSVHPGNNLVVASGQSSLTLRNVERAPGAVTDATGPMVLANTVKVTLVMGEDGVFSAGVSITLTCDTPPAEVECTSLTATMMPNGSYRISVEARVENAMISSYDISFGDGESESIPTSDTSVSTNHTYAAPETYTVNASINYASSYDPSKTEVARCKATTVKISEAPKVVCKSLVAVPLNDNEYRITVTAEATAATIVSYDINFGDGGRENIPTSSTTASTTHTYEPGRYTISARVNFQPDLLNSQSTTARCQDTTIDVGGAAAVRCTSLRASLVGDNEYRVTIMAEAENATIVSYDMDFGDGTTDTVTTSETTASANHTYSSPGTYTIKGRVNFQPDVLNDQPTTVNCKDTKVTVSGDVVAVCNRLVELTRSGSNITYQADATVENTTISSYLFKVNGNEVQNTSSDRYVFNETRPGTYTITAQVVTPELTSPVGGCKVEVTIKGSSALACNALRVQQLSRNEFRFTVEGSATGDAKINEYILADMATDTIIASNANGTFTERLPDGQQTLKAYVVGMVDGERTEVTSPACQKRITVEPDNPPIVIHDCVVLEATRINDTIYDVSAVYTSGTSPDRHVYKVNGVVVQDSSTRTYRFVETAAGTYTIELVAYGTDGDKDYIIECEVTVRIVERGEVEAVVIAAAKELPNTGAGEIVTIGLASALSLGMFGHYTARHLYLRQFE